MKISEAIAELQDRAKLIKSDDSRNDKVLRKYGDALEMAIKVLESFDKDKDAEDINGSDAAGDALMFERNDKNDNTLQITCNARKLFFAMN